MCHCHFRSVSAALVTRLVFCLHCLVAFWRLLYAVEWNIFYFFLLTGLAGLLIETAVTLYVRKGAEYKWFCPSVFFYLATIVPCVWILELDMLDQRLELRAAWEKDRNITAEKIALQDERQNLLNNTLLDKILVPLELEPTQWVVMIEQLLLFVLILGRWMLPKGDISRDELSQLLLVYIGMAADIIEFFEAFKEEKVKYNFELTVTIMAIWSASLLQFTLVLTASKSKKTRAGFSPLVKVQEEEESGCSQCCSCCGTEVLGILTTMVLQDGPFLALRLLLLVRYEVHSYMHIFFTVKNSLVLLLMVYRLYVLFDTPKHEPDEDESVTKSRSEYLDLDTVSEPEKQSAIHLP